MATCVYVDPDNFLKTSSDSPQDCLGYILVDTNEYQLYMQSYSIEPLEVAEAFTWGFGTYITFWFLGYVVKNAIKTIKMV